MSIEAGAKSRWRAFRIIFLTAALTGAIAFSVLAWYVTTEGFHLRVRQRLVAELQKITGGRVELGSIHIIPFELRVEVRDLTIHGREASSEIPYAHVDSLSAKIKIISVLGAEFGFHSVDLDHPVIHIIVYPDGSTNQPDLKISNSSGGNPVERLFALSISRLSVRQGRLFWNDQVIPLDFVVDDVVADMNYGILRRRYEGNIRLGKVDCKLQNYRPFSGTLAVNFDLGSNDVTIQSLKVVSGKSQLEAHGRIGNFLSPAGEATYEITLDAGEIGAILREPRLRTGSVKLAGSGELSRTALYVAGKLFVKEFAWRDEYADVRNIAVSANYSVNRAQIGLSQIQAKLLGGGVTGEAELRNWMLTPESRAPKTAHKTTNKITKTQAEQLASIKLRAKDIAVDQVSAALSNRKLPLDRLHLAGAASASMEMRWKGSARNAEYQATAEVVPPAHLSPGQLPLAAHLDGTYRARERELQVSNLSVTTPASHVQAYGSLTSVASLKVTASTSDLREWQPLITMLHGPETIPVILHGRASFEGTANGNLDRAVLAGNLTADDFDIRVPSSAHLAEDHVHWDSLNTAVRVSQRAIGFRNGELQHDNTVINFDAHAGFENGALTPASPFRARVQIQQADLQEILALAGKDYSASGILNLTANAEGTIGAPAGNGSVDFHRAELRGTPIERLQSQFTFGAGELGLQRIEIEDAGATIEGNASYSWASHAISANLSGANFALKRIPQLQDARVAVDGRVTFKALVSGTPDEPEVDASLHLSDLTLDGQSIGAFNLETKTRGTEMTVSGRSQFLRETLNLDGNVHMNGDFPAHITASFGEFDVQPFLNRYLAGHVLGASPLSGTAIIEGDLRQPRDLSITANLGEFQADVERIQLHNDGPLRFSVAHQTLEIDQCRLVSQGTDVSASGSVQLAGDRELNLHAEGQLNLQLLSTYDSDFTSSGQLLANVSVSGTVDNPVLQGRLQVNNGSVAYIDLPSALSNINGSIAFNRNRAEIETLTAYTGGGLISFRGFAASYNRQLNFDLGVTGQDVRLRYPPGLSSTASMDLKFAGSSSASLLSGDITITKLGMTPGFDFGGYLAQAAQSGSLPQTNPLLNRIRMDVHVVTVPELQMQTAVVRLSGDADLHLRGTAARPVLLGRADVIEGEAYF
ncbi:MAG: translocation/assembly module TamB domain-containing protein, partial [Terriglobales bacterium]